MLNQRFIALEKVSFWARHKIKIASVIFAIFVWFLIVADGEFNYVVEVPVRLPSHPQFVITNYPTRAIKVRLEGNGFDLLSTLLFNETYCEPKVNWEAGNHRLPTSEKDIILQGNSKNLRIIQILEPDTITVTVEKIVSKMVAVEKQFTVKSAMGYTQVGRTEIVPDSVKISGPESFIKPISTIATEHRVFEGLKTPLKEEIALPPPGTELIKVNRNKVEIIADVQKIMEKKITNVPVRVENIPADMRPIVLPARIELLVLGGVELVSPLNPDSFDVYLDYLSPMSDGEHNFQPIIKPMEGVRIGSYKPERFKIVLEKD